jgi:hypothetical protein
MGRRRKISIKKRTYKRKPKTPVTISRKRMLNMGKISSFKFRLRGILEEVEGSEPIFANVNSKSINVGIEETKKYLEDVVKLGDIKSEKADEIIELLDRFSKYR